MTEQEQLQRVLDAVIAHIGKDWYIDEITLYTLEDGAYYYIVGADMHEHYDDHTAYWERVSRNNGSTYALWYVLPQEDGFLIREVEPVKYVASYQFDQEGLNSYKEQVG